VGRTGSVDWQRSLRGIAEEETARRLREGGFVVPEHGRGPSRPPFGLGRPQARVAAAEVRRGQIRTVAVLTFEMLDGIMRSPEPGDLVERMRPGWEQNARPKILAVLGRVTA